MLKACLVGLGGMGRGHFGNYVRMMEENKVELVAICDIDPDKFGKKKVEFNIEGVVSEKDDMSKFRQYTNIDEMLEKEKPEFVSLAIPTYLHCDYSIKCMKAGAHVFCEKPMALNVDDCKKMIACSKETGKYLMIGQVLRFWPEYEATKELINSGVLGKPVAGYYWRGGGLPSTDPNSWYMYRDKSGGCLFDQHVHDTDIIQCFYGMPKAVCSTGRALTECGGQDCVSTNYIYEGNFAINAQDDWSLKGVNFSMSFRANFENGSVVLERGELKAFDKEGKDITPVIEHESGYYKEIVYLLDLIQTGKPNLKNPPEESMKAIMIASAERKSADNNGALMYI